MTILPSSLKIEGSLIWRHEDPAIRPLFSHCFGILTKQCILIRSEAIENGEKWNELVQCAKLLSSKQIGRDLSLPLRITSMQLNTLENEWGMIQRQHSHLFLYLNSTSEKLKVVHTSFPTQFLFFDSDPESESEFLQQSLKKLLHHLNAVGWSTYGEWLVEDIEHTLASFHPEDSEEYQLQARLEDFCHEVHSSLFAEYRQELKNSLIAKEEALAQGNKSQLMPIETSIAKSRENIVRSIQIHENILRSIVDGISMIEDVHPELVPIKFKALMLSKLMGVQDKKPIEELTWSQRLLLHQFLDEKMGVISAINCNTGIERTNMIFAIRLALAELSESVGDSRILDLCLHWNESQCDPELSKQLRARVWENCLAINIINEESKKNEPIQYKKINHVLLSFFPVTASVHTDQESKIVPLLETDPKTNELIDCTRIGRRLLRNLGLC